MAADAGELKARATLDNTEFLGSLKDMVSQIQQNSENAAKHVQGMSDALLHVGEAVEGLAITDKIVDFGKECLDAALAVNRLHASFEALNGSSEQTEQVFEQMKDLGLHSMFDFADVIGPAAQQMMLLGVSAEQTAATMTAVVDAATNLKQGPEWVNQVTGAIDNMQSHLVASQRDMKALSQSGIDAWGDLATSLGVSIAQAQKMVKDGVVTSTQVIAAVTDDLKQRGAGAADTVGTTWVSAMHVLEASGEEAKESIGQSILAVLNDLAPVIKGLADLLLDFKAYWDGLSEPVKNAVIALGAALVVVGGITAALPLLSAAAAGVAAIFGGWTLPIVAAVAALALIGKWIYDEWPAIKAVFLVLWDDIKATWDAVVAKLGQIFAPLVLVWTAEWGLVKTVLGAVWDWVKEAVAGVVSTVSKVVNAVIGFFGGMPGAGELNKLAAAWNTGQKAIDDNAAAVAAHTKELKDNQTATALTLQQRKQQEASDLAAANAAKAAAAEKSKADAAAKKAADEQKKYNEDLEKTYTALAAVAPDVAAQFSAMYGGINKSAVEAQKVMGTAWATASDATKKLVTDTLALRDAYTVLGVTNSAVLEAAVGKTEAAYTTVANSGKATAGDLAEAFDKIVAAQQKAADHMNTDVKDAYAAGKITAEDYWDTVVERAAAAVDEAKAAYEDGFATEQDVAAKEKILLADRTAAFNKQQADYTTAMNAVGDKTSEQLGDATDQWNKYAANIAQKLGVDSKGYIDAQIKLTQSLIEQYTGLGKPVPDALTQQLKDWQAKLEANKLAAMNFADAMKALGVNTTQDAVAGIGNMAAALDVARQKSDGTKQSQLDLQLGEAALEGQIKKLVDTYNNQWKVALDNGDITQTQYLQHMKEGAAAVVAQFGAMAAEGKVDTAAVVAAQAVLDQAMDKYGKQTLVDVNTAYSTLGVQSQAAMDKMRDTAVADFAVVAASANTNGTTYMNAWINAHQKIYDTLTAEGTSLSAAQKEDMGKMEAKRTEFLDAQKSAWTTAYGEVKTTISTAFDDLTKTIITGKGSFGDLMTNMWQGLAETALNAFIKPLKDAVTNFISHELADLLGDQGLGGVMSSLKNIGSSISGIFSGAPGGLATSASTMGQVGQAIPGVEGAATTGTSAATSAATSIAGSLTSTLGAIGSIGSFVAGAIGDIQNIHMANVMGQVESNTRYSALYLGGRADQGILGILFTIHEEIAWGANTQAISKLRDLFLDWSGPALDSIQGIRSILESWGPYITDSRDALFDIRDSVLQLGQTVASGFQTLTVTINAGNLTTADAARQLGDQIAKNLSGQLVAVKA